MTDRRHIPEALIGASVCALKTEIENLILVAVMKKGVTADAVHKRLEDVFQDAGIGVWDCTLV